MEDHTCCNLEELEKLRAENSELKSRNEMLKGFLNTIPGIAVVENFAFICGELGEAQGDGLADGYLICPAYGSDIVGVYKKVEARTPEF